MMRAIDSEFVSIAAKEALKSPCKQGMGAVLVKNKRVIAQGYNRFVGIEPVLTHYGLLYTLHAEMEVIRKAGLIDFKGHTLYIGRWNNKMAKPCEVCMKVIVKAQIPRIVYSTNTSIEEIKFNG